MRTFFSSSHNIEYHRKKFSLLEFSQRRSKFDFLPRSFAAHSKSPPQHLQTWMYGTPSSSTINQSQFPNP
jgi:hypothetical protein